MGFCRCDGVLEPSESMISSEILIANHTSPTTVQKEASLSEESSINPLSCPEDSLGKEQAQR